MPIELPKIGNYGRCISGQQCNEVKGCHCQNCTAYQSIELPKIENYGRYTNENYGHHMLKATVDSLTVWFSYETPVAFQVADGLVVVRQNDWGVTTGKHLSWIDGGSKDAKAKRVSSDVFTSLYQQALDSSQGVCIHGVPTNCGDCEVG